MFLKYLSKLRFIICIPVKTTSYSKIINKLSQYKPIYNNIRIVQAGEAAGR